MPYHPALEGVEPTHESLDAAAKDVLESSNADDQGSVRATETVVLRSNTELEAYFVYEKFVVDTKREEVNFIATPQATAVPPVVARSPFTSNRTWKSVGLHNLGFWDRFEESRDELVQKYTEETGHGPAERVGSGQLIPPLDTNEHVVLGPPNWDEDLREWKYEFLMERAGEQLEKGNLKEAAELKRDIINENLGEYKKFLVGAIESGEFEEAEEILEEVVKATR